MAFLRNILIVLTLLVTSGSAQSTNNALAPGSEAPRFYTSTIDDTDFFLSRKVGANARAHEKAPIILSFFTTTCIPCRQEIPYLDSLQTEFPQIAFYLVNVAEEPQIVKEYLRKMKYNLPVLVDRYGLASKKYSATITPTLVGIDIDGRIAFVKRGFRESDKEMIRNNVEKLAGAKSSTE